MSEPPTVRVLTAEDAPAYREARLLALQSDPQAFITTAEEFAARTLEDVAARLSPTPTSCTFGAFLNGELVGLLTVARETRPALAHRANIYGVSVRVEARGQGCGDTLLQAGLAQARMWPGVTSIHLAVTETQTAARRLYERHGFRVWGTQPDAVRVGERVLTEHWLWLGLFSSSPLPASPTRGANEATEPRP
ncbi:GNAT family N-acetyltransferase [Deinococcus sp. YIM 134068]|uniref:GNAT family N-acetyltransferase n=1 Tax=Deinococcus lichenicola TaxID=3118910 RepID=UPI002F93CCFB